MKRNKERSPKRSKKTVGRPPPRRWHYTIEIRLAEIVESGAIRPAFIFLDDGERPAVWTSTNPVWEETANKRYDDEVTGQNRFGTKATTASRYGLARIEVRPEAAPHDWIAFRAQSGIRPHTAALLARAGKSHGASAHDWFVSFEPIAEREWLAVEVWKDGCWVPFGGWKKRDDDW